MRLAMLGCAADSTDAFVAIIDNREIVIKANELLLSKEVSQVNMFRGLGTKMRVSLWRDQATGKFRCGPPY